MENFQIELLDNSKQRWEITDYLTIGRASTCQIQISAVGIDDRHARIEKKNNCYLIKDLRSTSGCFVNGAKVLEAYLKDGDMVTLGNTDFVIHDPSITPQKFQLTSRNDYWNQQLQSLTSVSSSNCPILILGPSGTGKDVLANAIHKSSKEDGSPFISVNCSALTETLVESELFGHTKGSFTGALSDRKGAFETARGGTLFLDEIGDLPYSLQAKLLRALENNEIRPVGSDRPVKTDVRIIAATHQNLYNKIRDGEFRADLFYRLNVITIETPSLKERIEDFDDLLYSFARQMRVRFSFNAIKALKQHDWPGNIRELKNVISRAAALYPKQYIEESHINHLLNRKEKIAHAQTGVSYLAEGSTQQLSVIREIEKQMIIKRLAANAGNQKRTASDLGMPKSTLHDRIKNYSIDVNQFKVL